MALDLVDQNTWVEKIGLKDPELAAKIRAWLDSEAQHIVSEVAGTIEENSEEKALEVALGVLKQNKGRLNLCCIGSLYGDMATLMAQGMRFDIDQKRFVNTGRRDLDDSSMQDLIIYTSETDKNSIFTVRIPFYGEFDSKFCTDRRDNTHLTIEMSLSKKDCFGSTFLERITHNPNSREAIGFITKLIKEIGTKHFPEYYALATANVPFLK